MKRGTTCSACNGTGHTSKDRPEIEVKKISTPKGPRLKHITHKQGSGCINCQGLGVR